MHPLHCRQHTQHNHDHSHHDCFFHQALCNGNNTLDRVIWGPSFSAPSTSPSIRIPRRTIPRLPERILDAPGLRKVVISSPISWCRHKSILAVALDSSVYLWQETSGTISSQLSFSNQISSAHWVSSSLLAIGSTNGLIILWEPTSNRQLFLKKEGISASINSIANGPCGTIVAGDSLGNLFFYFTSGVIKSKINAHQSSITSIFFEHRGILATSDSNGNINIWKISELSNMSTLCTSILKYSSSNYPLKVCYLCYFLHLFIWFICLGFFFTHL